MFSKQKTDRQINDISTIIGEDTTVQGTLTIESSIRIDGKVFGEINCNGDITVGKDGYVENHISARNLFIAGKVKGNVKVENKIHIYDSGHLEGSAEMKAIIIDENGFFHGESFMKSQTEVVNLPKQQEKQKQVVNKK